MCIYARSYTVRTKNACGKYQALTYSAPLISQAVFNTGCVMVPSDLRLVLLYALFVCGRLDSRPDQYEAGIPYSCGKLTA
jgi:hypothetical protein